MKRRSLYAIIVVVLWTAICVAQSTNGNSPKVFTDWGASVHGVRLAVALTNNTVPVGSEFVVFVRIENASTNIISLGESSAEGDFAISLKDKLGNSYKLTRRPLVYSRLMLVPLAPNEIRDWVILAKINRYYEPPEIFATKKDVPPGGYVLKVARTFIPEKGAKPLSLEANALNVNIE